MGQPNSEGEWITLKRPAATDSDHNLIVSVYATSTTDRSVKDLIDSFEKAQVEKEGYSLVKDDRNSPDPHVVAQVQLKKDIGTPNRRAH
jgi:hypothetical protein